MAGNPFRKGPGETNRSAELGGSIPPLSITPAKKKKKVKIVSPHSPEDEPRRRSSGNISPPPPPPEYHDDGHESDSTATADSDLEQATLNTRRNSGSLQSSSLPQAPASGAPYNPFARTLASSETAFGLQQVDHGQKDAGTADERVLQGSHGGTRPAMDVDAFRNILMTGSAVPSPGPAPSFQDSISSTDVSSRSRNSFDPYLSINSETPRTSFDNMEHSAPSDDDEEGSSLMSGSVRLDDFAPPAPPKNSQVRRGPQTVSFADFEEFGSTASKTNDFSSESSNSKNPRSQKIQRSLSDLNKPLPPPPQNTALQKNSSADVPLSTTHPTEVTAQTTKAAPPPPPSARRAAHTTGHALDRSPSAAKSTVEASSVPAKPAESNSKSASIPPPPPTRKARPISQSTAPAVEAPSEAPLPASSGIETKLAPMPPPPPRRNPSKSGTGTSVNRSSSNASHSSMRKENQPPNNSAPAPPPPRRGNAKRESMDGAPSSIASAMSSRRSSDNERRRSSQISVESGRNDYSGSIAEGTEPVEAEQPRQPASNDILADMNALQAEIDALRAQAEKG